MSLTDYSKRLLSLAEAVHLWLGSLSALDRESRDRIAKYSDEVAATLARAAVALQRLAANPDELSARVEAMREFGRIAGYIETIVGVLQHHLDGRKLAGVKRRLELLAPGGLPPDASTTDTRARQDNRLIGRLVAAEGYFRALADGLRT
ncbi:MAG: hypothetical protein C0511_12965 [Hyphomicrobium sp.]|nr:hypothetical protein [Hyphomicrobium sp.]